jgi:hypothetical protein
MTTVGNGSYRYEHDEQWAKLPDGWTFGQVSAVATDSQDRVYAFQRKDPPVIVFDRNGTYLASWGSSAIADPHGICIVDDVIYLTDRNDHVAMKYTLDGKPLMVLGRRGQPSDTGATKDIELPPRSAGPFNKPTEMMVAPSGDLYVSDGYRNSRVHRFSPCSIPGASRASRSPESSTCPTASGSTRRATSTSATARTAASRSSPRGASSSPSGETSTSPPTSTSTPRRSPT